MKQAIYSVFGVYMLANICLAGAPVSAAPVPDAFGAPSENGRIDSLDLKAGEVVVDDTLFKLSRQVAVYTHGGYQTGVDALRKGMRIAFNVTQDATGTPYVAVIRILSTR